MRNSILLLSALLFYQGCVNEPPIEPGPSQVTGFVTDENDVPLENVEVHYIFYTNRNYSNNGGTEYFRLGVENPQPVHFAIYDPFHRRIATVFDGDTLGPGLYTIGFWQPLTNGFYTAEATLPDTVISYMFYRRSEDVEWLSTLEPLTRTETGGWFALLKRSLGYESNLLLQRLDETMADSLTIVLFKGGYRPFSETFNLGSTRDITRRFKMTKK